MPDLLSEAAGMTIESLAPGSILDVTTWNTRYRVVVLDGEGRAVISGGTHFQEPTEVRIEGSTTTEWEFRAGWIGVGLRLGMTRGARTITTSPIRSVVPVAA